MNSALQEGMTDHRWQVTAGALLVLSSLGCADSARLIAEGAAGADVVAADGAAAAGAGGADAGATAHAGAAGTGGAYPACAAPPELDASAAASSRVGFELDERDTLDGVVSSVSADQLQITTPEGVATFRWRGPPLDAGFSVGEDVAGRITFAGGGLAPPRVSTVVGPYATAIAVEGASYRSLSKEPGATTTLSGLRYNAPELVYALGSCCTAPGQTNICDYSSLTARQGSSTVAIAAGATGTVGSGFGSWAITNLDSTYLESRELVWSIRVTLLGPGERIVDAGN